MQSRMHILLKTALADQFTRAAAQADFAHAFQLVGQEPKTANDLSARIITSLDTGQSETSIYEMMTAQHVGTSPLLQAIDTSLQNRAATIFNQVHPHFQDVSGHILDFGAGDGQITQLLANAGLAERITGVDVRAYRNPNVTAHIDVYNGRNVRFGKGHFDAALATNVLHHAEDNEMCIEELSRVTRNRLVIIETVPIGQTPADIEKDRLRTFMNDYFYNRLLHDPKFDVPVPGTYETPQGWIDRFENHGWRNTLSQNLGIDIPVIQDTHHLLVFER